MAAKPHRKAARLVVAPIGVARDAIGTLTPGCRIVGVNKGQFSLIDIIDAVLEQVGAASVFVSTWTPGKNEINRVALLLEERKITDFRLLVDRSFMTRHPEYLKNLWRLGMTQVRQTRTHAKFALIAAGDWRITVRTSMNFNTNPRLEQFDLDDDPVIYDFFDGVVEHFFTAVPMGNMATPKQVEQGFKSAFSVVDGDDDDPGSISWSDMSWDNLVWTEIEEA